MANTDSPMGFTPVYMLDGSELPPVMKGEHTTGTAVFRGDLLKVSSGNFISVTSNTDVPIAVALEYVAAAEATGTLFDLMPLVPGMVLKAQVDDGTLADSSSNWTLIDYVLTHSGSTTTGQSAMEIDGNASTRDSFYVIDKVDTPDNAWGTNVKIYVTPAVTALAVSRTVTA